MLIQANILRVNERNHAGIVDTASFSTQKRHIWGSTSSREVRGIYHHSFQQGTHVPVAARKHLLMAATKTDVVQFFQDNMRTTWTWWITLPQKVFKISRRILQSVFMLPGIQSLLQYLNISLFCLIVLQQN